MPLSFEVLAQLQQASTMNIQSTHGYGAVVNWIEEFVQQGIIVLHWSANNSIDYIQYYTRWLIIAKLLCMACSHDYALLRLKGVAWLAYGCVDQRE